jgi:hypothetical protein
VQIASPPPGATAVARKHREPAARRVLAAGLVGAGAAVGGIAPSPRLVIGVLAVVLAGVNGYSKAYSP